MTIEKRIREAGPKFLALRKHLSETEWAILALPQARDRVKDAESAAESAQDCIRQCNKRAKEHHERLGRLRHYILSRTWNGGKESLEDEIEQEENAWLKEFAAAQAAKTRAEQLEKEITGARKIYDQCEKIYKAQDAARKDLAALLEGLFGENSSAYPYTNELKQSLVLARQELRHVEPLAKRQEYITATLQEAQQLLSLAEARMHSALDKTTNFDPLVGDTLGKKTETADDLITKAETYISTVHTLEPAIPHLREIRFEKKKATYFLPAEAVTYYNTQRYLLVQKAALTLQRDVLPAVLRKSKAVEGQVKTCKNEISRLEEAILGEGSRIVMQILGVKEDCSVSRSATFHGATTRIAFQTSFVMVSQTTAQIDEPPPPYSIQ